MQKQNRIITLSILSLSMLLLSACGAKKPESNTQPTPTVTKLIELTPEEQPYIKLIPRADGHELKLVIQKLNTNISEIDYELIYTATDNGQEIEKGVSGNMKVEGKSVERDLLLGTASCTNGCKYKYDTGISQGTLMLTLATSSGQVSTFETPFTLKSAAALKTEKEIKLPTANFSVKVTPKTGEYYTVIKNALVYSVFSSNTSNPLVSETPLDN
ncbi:MAG: hypothetical protein WC841_01900 [Candidatus Shapirobacteria bacterium]|jgi:hypothetical protein